ncbi:MAG: cytidine deaminase [Rikenellaceae bacterium]|nr:cytidine deaminase [Rikenellaceae bacterium]
MRKGVELSDIYRSLVESSMEAQSASRSPYSEIKVGAAALMSSGAVVTGANWESPSYPAGVCAERSMLSSVFSSHGSDAIEAVAVTASRGGVQIDISPCGICRQSLLDAQNMQGRPFAVIFRYGGEYVVLDSATELLPFAFGASE